VSVIAPIIYLGPPMVCAAPLLFLYWLYRPTVLTNPGLSALQAPAAMAVLLPPSQPESGEDAGTSNQVAVADVAEAFDPHPADKEPKSLPGSRGSHPIAARRSLRFAGNVRRPPSAYDVGAAFTNPGQYAGVSPGAASAYAYAVEQSSRYRW
jgi:hypothetical protein